jgi:predicted RNA-binding Zn-ribbon protein involved in translation (DUF1610 family)
VDAGSLIGAVIALLALVFSVAVTLVSLLVPLAVTGLVTFVIYKQLQSGNATLVLSGPAALLAQAALDQGPPRAKRLKKVVCRSCGGSKVLPPKTAYVYCDYCGALVDYDFQIACRTAGSAKPGPAYEAIQRTEAPKQAAAREQGDQGAFRDSVRRVFETHFRVAPASWSPRIGDPEYREALLTYTANTYTAAAFDTECHTLEQVMGDSVKRLVWVPGFKPMVQRASFDKLLEAVLAHTQRFVEAGAAYLPEHPDQPSNEVMRSMSRSVFAQGWLPYLDKAGQDAMIERLDLGGEYIDIPEVETQTRRCGGCARELHVAAGAKRVVCEDCGHANDTTHPEITCSGCGSQVSVLFSKRSFQCPKCAMELRVD